LTNISIGSIRQHTVGLEILNVGGESQVIVDAIIVATGARPSLNMLRELRLEVDASTEATKAPGPLIDPNQQCCGTAPSHGAEELKQPERGFYLAGMKSYGRAHASVQRGRSKLKQVLIDRCRFEHDRRGNQRLPKKPLERVAPARRLNHRNNVGFVDRTC
jgi:hypothetical protein